jgi:triacylglycerol lipase
MKGMARHLREQGFTTFAPDLRPNTGRRGLDELARDLKAFVDERISVDEQFSLVGFSMGGLISRYYLQRLNGLARVRRFISISTPHHGSWFAFGIPNRGCRQMRPGSEFLRDLNRDLHCLEKSRVVSIWTPFDITILPSSSSRIPIGRELTLPIVMHRLMISDRRTHEAVAGFLKT